MRNITRVLASWLGGIFRRRILIIHAEGNVFNNPNLYEIANFLGERFKLDILVPLRPINRGCAFTSRNIRLVEYLPIFGDFRFMRTKSALDEFCAMYLRARYRLIIGVDRGGLILAALLASRLGPPYGMISYEIFFEEETSSAFKRPERLASAGLSFLLAPDKGRGNILIRENQVQEHTEILHVPVAPARSYPYQKRRELHDLLGIPEDRKILLFVGSVSAWTGIQDLLTHVNALPDDWVLVLHDRYGDTQSKVRSLAAPNLQNRVYLSNISIPTNEHMHRLLHSADLGLALYKPDYSSMWVGKNLAQVGLSSGKISVYLQHGLPVIISRNEDLSPLVERHDLGHSIDSIDELFGVLQKHKSSDEQKRRCVAFFEEYLSLDNHKGKLLNLIRKNMKRSSRRHHGVSEEILLQSVRESVEGQEPDSEWTFEEFSAGIEKLRESGEQFVIYGEDTLGQTIQALMPEHVVAFVDYKSDLVSTDIVTGGIYAPQNLPNMRYDRILIGILGQEAHTVNHLVHDLGLPEERVVRTLAPSAVSIALVPEQ